MKSYRTQCWCVGNAYCLLFLFLGAGASTGQTSAPHKALKGSGGIAIPFTYDPVLQPFLVIQIGINGEAPLPFLVDTGLNLPMLIDAQAAGKLKLHPSKERLTPTPGTVSYARTDLKRVELPAADAHSSLQASLDTAYVGDLRLPLERAFGQHLAGAVGMPLFANTTVRFDFAARRMTFYLDPAPPHQRSGATSLPLRTENGLCYVPLLPDEGLAADLLLDTGRNFTSLPATLTVWLEPSGSNAASANTAGGAYLTDKMLLPMLPLGDFKEPDVVIYSEPSTGIAALGMNLLSRFLVTIDFRNGVLFLEHPSDYETRIRVDGKSGITLLQRDTHFYIDAIENGSAAEQAGVRSGDRLIQVDGYPLDTLPKQAAQHLLDGFAETQAHLTLERTGAAPFQVHFARARDFLPPAPPHYGLVAEREPEGDLKITAVLKGLPAEQAGLLEGDAIIEINGEPTAKLTPRRIKAAINKPQLTLTIRRRGADKPLIFHLKAGP